MPQKHYILKPFLRLKDCFWENPKVSHKRVFALLTPEIQSYEMAQMLQKPVFALPSCQRTSVNTLLCDTLALAELWLKHDYYSTTCTFTGIVVSGLYHSGFPRKFAARTHRIDKAVFCDTHRTAKSLILGASTFPYNHVQDISHERSQGLTHFSPISKHGCFLNPENARFTSCDAKAHRIADWHRATWRPSPRMRLELDIGARQLFSRGPTQRFRSLSFLSFPMAPSYKVNIILEDGFWSRFGLV